MLKICIKNHPILTIRYHILTICIKNHRTLTILIKNHCTKNSHKNHCILTIRMKNHYTNNFMIFFEFINQINKHKAKIYNQCMYTQIIIKKFQNYINKFHPTNINNFLFGKYKDDKFII